MNELRQQFEKLKLEARFSGTYEEYIEYKTKEIKIKEKHLKMLKLAYDISLFRYKRLNKKYKHLFTY